MVFVWDEFLCKAFEADPFCREEEEEEGGEECHEEEAEGTGEECEGRFEDAGTDSCGGLGDAFGVGLCPFVDVVEHDGEVAVVIASDFVTDPDPGVSSRVLQAVACDFDLRCFGGIGVVIDEGDVFGGSGDGADALDDAIGESEGDGTDDGEDASGDDEDDGASAFEA